MLTKRDLLRSAALAAMTATTAKPIPALAQTSAGRPGFFKAKDIAEAGFIYGLPIVMNFAVMYEYAVDRNSGQFKAPFNQIKNEPNVFTYKDTAIVTPNSDTPYSFVWMDLRAEPIVLSVPAVDPKRYYAVQLCDGNTYNYGYVGTRTTGSEAGDYMVVGPDWKGATPPGIKKVFRSSTQLSLAGYRTQLFSPDDLDNIKKVQAGYKVQTLSAYLRQPATVAAATVIDFPKIDKELVKTNFFEFLDFALQFAPAQENEKEIRAQLATIGIGPGKTFNFKDLPLEQKLEVGLGMKEGERKVDEGVANAGKAINGWRVSGLPGDSAHYNGDWLKRAVAAKAGIYGNSPEEATYPLTRIDSDGQTLDGSKNNYTLTFPPGQLPPVNAFWSLTMYDGKTQLLIENPINRYLINSPMLPAMKTSSDGSLTLYIQNKSPGADKESNWLPAPDGPIYLVMRLYSPKTTSPSILPPGEGTWQPPGVKRVS
ncbi:DUF1254 domain-containing protein [Bradyrhizobium rifense]|uniref:DUF1254 domain-containing protein n=1 Tax=Bradyrhizobium rifense TaxID=515499 RepID=A0A5D3KF60_9BRAD|nr:DUF1254 domain-containing protein [Bradyrhizobium rifense]TYL93957.1 DUF1254 domain-containing protein [Bradyrhizobium rifense]